ncbi:MAG: diacylglycerol kinase family lipid kinase [Verrucomicrobia bacterium]|nr:diacylglycerol kinase family lipid kinase [Verrucomicrobiota bacterium]
MPRRVLVIANPAAAGGAARRARSMIELGLQRRGLSVEVIESIAAGQIVELAQSCANAGHHDLIAAAGGDGTAREVAAGVLGSSRPQTPVAILPLGTGNDLAHVAGTPRLNAALDAIAAGHVRPIDAIEVICRAGDTECTTFAMSFAAVGLASDVVRLTTPAVKRWFGRRLCYSVGFFRALAGYQPVPTTVVCDGREYRDDYLLICAGNTTHAGGQVMHLSPGADCRDGLLNLSLIKAATRLEVALRFADLRRGTHVRHPHSAYFPVREVQVTTSRPADVQLDGDNIGTTPARFHVRPAALHLVCGPVAP